MDRRQFLRSAVLAAGSLAACSPISRSAPETGVDRTRPKKVVVLGAGLAGLLAGHELIRAGHEVTIVEARERAGGRVHTIREPFEDGLHAEAGAMFIPSSHRLTLEYARLFNLRIEPSTPLWAARLFYVRGRRIVPQADTAWPFDLTAEERSLGYSGIWQKYLGATLDALDDTTAPGWPSEPTLERYDRVSMAGFLKAQGASPGAIALLRLGYLDLFGDGIESYSALYMLRDLARRKDERQRFSIVGGNDRLAAAFATSLAGRMRYGAPVVRIEPGERSAAVVIGGDSDHERLEADRIVCALPFSVLRRLEVSPSFSARKRRAIEELPYTSVARVYLQSSRRIWNEENPYVSVTTDRPIMWMFDQTANQPGRRGILEAQAVGPGARRIAQMTDKDRVGFATKQVEEVYRGFGGTVERAVSRCWDDDPWARGAFAYFEPGQMQGLVPDIARPEGRIHFAGEHTSSWPGWMQGALESGLRVAREVDAA